jgi:3-hydroxymyristoyl/3-hydroxydecanoyl-(acyl carrier protein) dehydratase
VFAGHFPDAPIVPGAALLDAALHAIEQIQAAGAADDSPARPGAPRHHIATLKFFRPARPAEALLLVWARTPEGSTRFEWRVGAERIASGTLSAIST